MKQIGLGEILRKHQGERICVVGTMCCGKTTIIKQLPDYNCVDMDDEFWVQISKEEMERLSLKPITKEIMDRIYELVYQKISVKPGRPLFGVVILDCEVVVYLNISKKLLAQHCFQRGDTDYQDALFVKKYLENDLKCHEKRAEKVFYYLDVSR